MASNSKKNTIGFAFEVVAQDEVPSITRGRRGGGGQYAAALDTLRTLEVGQALSLVVEHEAGDTKPINTVRQGLIAANRAHGQGMEIATRTSKINETSTRLYFIKESEPQV